MNKLCSLLNLKSEDELFDRITSSFKEKITRWDYFVNWHKVNTNVLLFEKELNILNYLIGKENFEELGQGRSTARQPDNECQQFGSLPVIAASGSAGFAGRAFASRIVFSWAL